MLQLTAETTILLLRLALLGALYLFVLLVVISVRRDLRRSAAQAARVAEGRLPSSARLVVLDPGRTSLEAGARIPLQPVTRIGRSEASTVVLDDSFVSGDHAVISLRDGAWWLADRGSTNGTLVNDEPVQQEVNLSNGDVIGLGQIQLQVAP